MHDVIVILRYTYVAMRMSMALVIILLLLVCNTHCGVYNVIPDDIYYDLHCSNTTCQQCHTLQYYQLNATKYFTSNIQLLFFPGLHHLHSDLIIENVQNISFIGTNISDSSKGVIIDCNLLAGFVLRRITNLVMENIMIKDCQTQYFSSYNYAYGCPDVVIIECSFIKLNHVKIHHNTDTELYKVSLLGFNVMGNSSLDHVTCDMRLNLYYNETNMSLPIQDPIVSINHYRIQQKFCVITIVLNQLSYGLTLQVSNTVIRHEFLDIRSSYASREKYNTLVIANCQFKDLGTLLSHNISVVYFKNCEITVNHSENRYLYHIKISRSEKVTFSHCIFHDSQFLGLRFSSNTVFKHCMFNHNNYCNIVNYIDHHFQLKPATIIIENTSFNASKTDYPLMSFSHSNIILIGPVKFHRILLNQESIIELLNCTVSIYGYIEFSHNTVIILIKFICITKECFTVNVADNSTLIVTENTLGTYFFAEWPNSYSTHALKFKPCFFQYLSETLHNGQPNYSITFNRNTYGVGEMISIVLQTKFKYTSTYYRLMPLIHCYWLPHSTYTTATIPLDVNKKYVKFANNSKGLPVIKNEKLLCYCINDTHYDCHKDELGYLYPGQTAAVQLCYPLADKYVDNNVEVVVDVNFNQTHFTPCVVYKGNETVQMFNKNCTTVHYTIAFLTDGWCELFLKVPFNSQMEYSVFYVRELLCPLGFIKKDGICQCYSLFTLFDITDCDINKQAVLRPANSWIYASNYDEYIISKQCPFHYCKTIAFYLNLSTPEVQCQFNRSGILCGQCQHGFSTVFSSSHCHSCSSTYILLTIPIAIAGLVLVVLIFLLNLTVTDGTINAFILYVNIISVNSTVFFPGHNSHQTGIVYILISIANLDLGIKTCFYNGMDDYAKIWLQLAFPFYLIFIATLIIITSRYSNIIQKMTSHRALPVLATLFLLSYTKILRTVCNVLFLYSSVTHLPSKDTTWVWSVDANVPLFGVQFILLFVVCLILFLVLIPFNVILLFTRTLSRFNYINKFKPLLDAYQGPYKIKFYYWTGLQLVMRTVFFGLSSLDTNINLPISITILSITNVVHTCSKPFKSKIKNYQELLLILNLLVLYTFAVSSAVNDINTIAVNGVITIAFTQFSLIVMYHITVYGCSEVIKKRSLSLYHDVLAVLTSKFYKKSQAKPFEFHHCNIPEVTYNYHEYQEPLIGQEYCQ